MDSLIANAIEILVFGCLIAKWFKSRVVAAVTGWTPGTWIAVVIAGNSVAAVAFIALIAVVLTRPDTLRQWLFAISG